MSRRTVWLCYFAVYACVVVLLFGSKSASAAESVTFPARVSYSPARWTLASDDRIRVCPLPTEIPACILGDGWVDPVEKTPIAGYTLRTVLAFPSGWVTLYFCPDDKRCEGDE